MRVLAFNSSPNMKGGGTSLILNPFLEGTEQAGARVELFFVHKLNIEPCMGCQECWWKTPGRCVHKDDMDMLYSKLAVSDILVLATPLHMHGMPGKMKTLIDRFVALLEPFIEICEGHCQHPSRQGIKQSKKVVLVSVCDFTEMDNFYPLVRHIKAICKDFGWKFAGALLRPYVSALPGLKHMGLPVDDIYEAARNAGIHLVQDGKIPSQDSATVSRELVSRKTYIQARNAYSQEVLDVLGKKEQTSMARKISMTSANRSPSK